MQFGTFYFFQAAPGQRHEDIIRGELEQIVWSEELGFDEIWLTEHHFINYGLSVDPATLAAAAASRTQRIRIGLAAAILPFHHPLRFAEQMALVDIISNGRLDVGVGRGNRPMEFRGYRVPQEESRDRFDEAVEIMRRAWTDRKSTRLNSSHVAISYAVFCLKKKKVPEIENHLHALVVSEQDSLLICHDVALVQRRPAPVSDEDTDAFGDDVGLWPQTC